MTLWWGRRSSSWFGLRLLALGGCIGAVLLSSATSALGCVPSGRTHRRADQGLGWIRDISTSWDEISGDMISKEPYVYTQSGQPDWGNFSYTFIMLNNASEWVQFGPATNNVDYRQTFIQCNDGGSAYNFILPAEPAQSVNDYTVNHPQGAPARGRRVATTMAVRGATGCADLPGARRQRHDAGQLRQKGFGDERP
jgi:hypothetical protein